MAMHEFLAEELVDDVADNVREMNEEGVGRVGCCCVREGRKEGGWPGPRRGARHRPYFLPQLHDGNTYAAAL